MSRKRTRTTRARTQAVTATVVAAVAVWVVAEPVLGFDLRGPAHGGGETHDVNAAVVAAAALAASLAGWTLLVVLERFTTRARSLWTAVALTVAVLSLAGPLSSAGITVANQYWLALMHVGVAVVLIPLLRRTTPRADSTDHAGDPAIVAGGAPR